LWRLRRAGAIETGLFEIQGELLSARRQDRSGGQPETLQTLGQPNGHKIAPGSNGRADLLPSDQEPQSTMRPTRAPWSKATAIAQCFLHLSKVDPTLLDRGVSYEAKLWRQATQTIWILDAMRRPSPAPIRRPFRKPVLSYWDVERE